MAPPPPTELIDDVTAEIFLHLPPDEPEHLFRAAFVCKPWLRVLCDPVFLRRYRAYHGAAPLLGLLHRPQLRFRFRFRFASTTSMPDFPHPGADGRLTRPLDCHHGRVLIRMLEEDEIAGYLVWNPVSGDRHAVPEPDIDWMARTAAVFCAVDGPFRVAFVGNDDGDIIWATVYSSETGIWSTPVFLDTDDDFFYVQPSRATLVGDEIYFTISRDTEIVNDWGNNCLSAVNPRAPRAANRCTVALMTMVDGSLGLAGADDSSLYLWSRKGNSVTTRSRRPPPTPSPPPPPPSSPPATLLGAHMAPPRLPELEEDLQLAELVKDWNFEEGKKFQARACKVAKRSVHHASSSLVGSFALLAVFRRYTFKLTEASVSLALHACLGGTPAGFHVTYIKDRHFKFVVSCKSVGFMVYELKRIITEQFDVYFHLWRDGGANWEREERNWIREEEQSWTEVRSKKEKVRQKNREAKKVRFATKLTQDSPASKAVPRELADKNLPMQSVKFGSFICRLNDAANTGFSPFSIDAQKKPEVEEEVEFQIPCKRVFGKLKRAPNINDRDTNSKCAAANTFSKRACMLQWGVCFKCLAQGHHVRECRGKFRCLNCYNYGHQARKCFKGKSKVNWTPKSPKHTPPSNGSSLDDTSQPEEPPPNPSASCSPSGTPPKTPSPTHQSTDTSPSPLNHPPNQSPSASPSTTSQIEEEEMAEIDIHPERFIPTGMEMEDGGNNRVQQATVCFSGAPIKRHEEFAIATTEEDLGPAQRLAFMHEVRDYIRVVARKQVISFSPHPHGIGIYRLDSACDRDTLVFNSPHWIGNRQFSFVNHDEAMNCRRSMFARVGWVMLVGYPLDYKEIHFINQACAPFGRVVQWHANDNSTARVLAKVLIDNIARVPRVLKLKNGRALDGEGRSWAVRVFILNSQFADQILDDDDDLPNNHNGGHANEVEANFVANLADLHEQQQGNVPGNQAQQNGQPLDQAGADSDNSSVNQAHMGQNIFIAGNGIEVTHDVHFPEINKEPSKKNMDIVQDEQTTQEAGKERPEPESRINNDRAVEEEDHFQLNIAMQANTAYDKQTSALEHQILQPQISPELRKRLEESIKALLYQCQQPAPYNFRQSIILDTSKIRINMIGQDIESVQIITEAESHAKEIQSTGILEINGSACSTDQTNKSQFLEYVNQSYCKKPIKKFYVRKKRRNVEENSKEQDLNKSKSPRAKKRSNSEANEYASSKTLRRSTRINNRLKGCKNRVIIETVANKSTRANKKRKIASFEELNAKLIMPTAAQEVEFPGLADLSTNLPFPEISTSAIQEIAVNKCGLSPSQVTQDLLLARNEEQETQAKGRTEGRRDATEAQVINE
ncbi:unnamed protein product [Urochloa humidicola]